MNIESSTESEWFIWFKIQERAIRISCAGEFEAAISELNTFLEADPVPDIKIQVIGLRGDIKRDRGDLRGARSDFLSALELSPTATFERFTLESGIGDLSEKLGELPEAEHWFLRALETAAKDPTFCGVSALKRISQVRDSLFLTLEERALAEQVVTQGWKVLELPGKPTLNDLFGSARTLYQAQSRR